VALAPEETITEQDLAFNAAGRPGEGGSGPLLSLKELERWHIRRVLTAVGGNRRAAARILGIDRSTLYRKLRQDASG